jgi:hypothetical protein
MIAGLILGTFGGAAFFTVLLIMIVMSDSDLVKRRPALGWWIVIAGMLGIIVFILLIVVIVEKHSSTPLVRAVPHFIDVTGFRPTLATQVGVVAGVFLGCPALIGGVTKVASFGGNVIKKYVMRTSTKTSRKNR